MTCVASGRVSATVFAACGVLASCLLAPACNGEFRFDEDFHEITTFLALGAITDGDVIVRNSAAANFPLLDRTFAKFGVRIEHADGWSRAIRTGPLKVQTPFTSNVLTKVEAAPWPYFPVDLLPIFIALGEQVPYDDIRVVLAHLGHGAE